GRFATLAVLEFSPVLDRGHAHFRLLFERRDRLLYRPRRIERGGRHHVVHAVVEVLDSELRLIEREIGVLWILRDLAVAQPPHRAVRDYDRAEALESRAAECAVLRKQEVAAPESFARHRAVGLTVDGENDARRVVRLRDALH